MTQHIDALEQELADLTAHLEVATHRQLAILRELEPTKFWAEQYASSFAHWLSWRIGLTPGVAREKLRVARALGSLPAIDAAFAAARLSYSKVRALSRVATPLNESALLETALHTTAAHLEQICRGIRRADTDSEIARDMETRWVRQRQGDHGMVRIEAQLHPDEAAIVWQAIERARAAEATPHADALVSVARSFDTMANGARPKSELVLHVREELLAEGSGAMAAVLDDGRRVPAETLRRVACDCVTQPVMSDGSGTPIDVGRKRRTVSPALRRALEARDGCCQFPGCAHRAWLDAHHIEHWLHGGATTMKNLVLLCSFHHRLVHEGGFTVVEREGRRVIIDPRGHDVPTLAPPPRLPADPLRALRLVHVSAGTQVDDTTLIPKWFGDTPDIGACVAAFVEHGRRLRSSVTGTPPRASAG